ncbi:hypothetical protein LCGC14_0356920 [marine sediment metagenome]|uniref:Uncharacterized protein n=1 Tax=marine sediment metagenome TaxID=412755 RepID=A0A0F9WH38_9ZZZZ
MDAIRLASSNIDTFEVTTVKGGKVLLQLEQPTRSKPDVSLSTGPTLRPDVGCRLSTCGMCVLNSLANHGQSYDYLKTLTNIERMRLHYRLHNDVGFEGTIGTVQRVTNNGSHVQKKGILRKLLGR